MKIHLIAIGGAAMHNIALDLNLTHEVTGSDDEIYNPSRKRLKLAGLLPKQMGWHEENITKEDNPELLKAKELGITIMSYPEFIFHQSKNKKRIVVAGSHGKTSTTSMILHVLKKQKLDFDYLVGAQIEGFERMVKLSDAPIIVLEGDEYLSSSLDRRPKMLHYQPNIAVITGVAWDHINVFPDFEDYKHQFDLFIQTVSEDGHLFYYKEDEILRGFVSAYANGAQKIPYGEIQIDKADLNVFGKHNYENMEAARLVCAELGIGKEAFAASIKDFTGAGKRLEILKEQDDFIAFLDFAHAPSKLRATTNAVRQKYPSRKIIAFFELHTFSSLNKEFIPHYKHCLDSADIAFVYFDPHTLEMKNMPDLSKEFVSDCFAHKNLKVLNSKEEVEMNIQQIEKEGSVLLMMSSGKFGGINIQTEIENLLVN